MEYYLKFGMNREFVKVIKIYLIFLSNFDRWTFFFRLCSLHQLRRFFSREIAFTIWMKIRTIFRSLISIPILPPEQRKNCAHLLLGCCREANPNPVSTLVNIVRKLGEMWQLFWPFSFIILPPSRHHNCLSQLGYKLYVRWMVKTKIFWRIVLLLVCRTGPA